MEALPPSLSDKTHLHFLTNTDHVEFVVSFHLVFHTHVNLSHPLNLIESSYRARVHYEHLTILNGKGIASAFYLLTSLQMTGETSRTPLPKNKNIKTFCKVSRSPARLPLRCIITLENIWSGPTFQIILSNIEERDNM